MGISPTARAVLFGAAFFVSAADAAWEVYRESNIEVFRYLDFDARPVGYCVSSEPEMGQDGRLHIYMYRGTWAEIHSRRGGSNLFGFDAAPNGEAAYVTINTVSGYWEITIRRFRRDGSEDVVEDGPPMLDIDAFSISGFDDIWFSGYIKNGFSSNPFVVVHYAAGEWEIFPSPGGGRVVDLHCFGPNDVCVITWPNNVYRWNGSTWTYKGPGPTSFEFYGVDYRSPNDIWAAGADKPFNYRLFRCEGVNWREVFDPGPNMHIYDVAMADAETGWAVGHYWATYRGYGRIWECRNGKWLMRVCPTEHTVSAVGLASATEAWAIAHNQLLVNRTGPEVTPASLGRIKSLYADGRGGDGIPSPSTASPPSVGRTSTATSKGRASGAGSSERPPGGAD
jgi:hypothetical protein